MIAVSKIESGTPRALGVRSTVIPKVLQKTKQWVLWKYEWRARKWTKVPYQTHGQRASTTDPQTWASFKAVLKSYRAGGSDGIGFVVTDDDEIVGIDLDHCRDPVTGQIEPWVAQIINTLDSYTELSPSGTGIRIFIEATWRQPVNRKGKVEIYSSGRYFTVTGNLLDSSTAKTIRRCQPELDAVAARYLSRATSTTASAVVSVKSPAVQKSWEEYQLRAMVRARERQDDRLAELYHGRWQERYASQSEADLALCTQLLQIAEGNRDLVDQLFRRSGLYRDKWDREDYRKRTLDRAESGQLDDEQWPEPLPLVDIQPSRLSPDLIRGPIGEFIAAVAAWSETPIELPVLAVLGVLSAAVGGKLEVSPEKAYSEPAHLFLCAALESGNRKSSVLSAATRPLLDWERKQQELVGPEIAKMASLRKTRVAMIEKMRRSLRGQEPEKVELIAQMEADLPKVPALPRVFTSDTTSERLEIMLAEQGGRAALISDEGGAFDVMGGRYSEKLNLDVFLKGHAGTPLRVQRVSRETVTVDNPALTVLLSPQPGVLAEMRTSAPLRHRGLLARFLYVLPPSPIGYRKLKPVPILTQVESAYYAIVERLLDWKPEARLKLSLSGQAYAVWKDFQRHVESEMLDGGKLSRVKDWGSKLPGAALRVAGILHAASAAARNTKKVLLSVLSADITVDETKIAVNLCDMLASHAIAVFGLISEDPATANAKRLLRWLVSQRKAEITKRECFRAHQPHVFDRVELMDGPLSILERHHLIIVSERKTAGRPQQVIELNPELFNHKAGCEDR